MKSAPLALVAGLASYVRASQTPGALKLDIARYQADVPSLANRVTGAVAGTLTNDDNGILYVINVTVGTPPQSLTLQIDTGSSDTWMPSSTSDACLAGNCTRGSYDMSQSSTAQEEFPGKWSVEYGDHSKASGDFITDVLGIGDVTVPNLTMGYATQSFEVPYGLMGVGLKGTEGVPNAQEVYPNLPYQLAAQGITNTAAFSLWLNDLASSTGNILFGAIDTAQYAGDLTLLDLWPEVGANDTTIQRYRVILTGVTAVSNTGSDNLGSHSLPYPALLDSGTTSTTLPDDLVAEIYMEVNATWNQQTQRASIPVDYYNSLGYLSFELGGSGGAIVNVSMKELVNPNRPGDYEDTYVFGIRPASVIGDVILGDTFLRSAYVVYDLVNLKAAIAQTVFNATDSNVVTFASSGAAVPSATPAPGSGVEDTSSLVAGAVTTTATAFPAASGFAQSATSASSNQGGSGGSSTSGANPDGGSASAGKVLGPSVGTLGVAVASALATVSGIFFLFG